MNSEKAKDRPSRTSAYISRSLKISFEDAVTLVSDALKEQGFTVISTMNVKDVLKKSMNIIFRNYRCLTAFIPELSYQAISLDCHAGLMIPCPVIVQEHENGEIEISVSNPLEIIDLTSDITNLSSISRKLNYKLRTAIDHLDPSMLIDRNSSYISHHEPAEHEKNIVDRGQS